MMCILFFCFGWLVGQVCTFSYVETFGNFYLAALTIDEPYDCPLQVGNANGLIAANGEVTIPLIPMIGKILMIRHIEK